MHRALRLLLTEGLGLLLTGTPAALVEV